MATPPPFKQLRIAIPCAFVNSFFSSGTPQATYALAAGFKGIGHSVDIIRITENAWFDDCEGVKDEFPIVPYTDFIKRAAEEPYDLFIDMDGGILPSRKRPYARRVATFLHRLPFVSEMEQILFAAQTSLRSMDGVDALMTWSSFHPQNGQMFEVMYKKPVIFVPFNWYHKAVASYSVSARLPAWLVSAQSPTKEWTCHIMESNHTMSSSAVLPMVIMSQLAEKKVIPFKDCYIHNGQLLEKSDFHMKNVHEHCTIEGLKYHYVGRQRVADWRAGVRNFVVAHNRFMVVKPALLDVVWSGIPVVHNSPWLRDLGHGLETMYYDDNDILGAVAATGRMVADFEVRRGFFAAGELEERQKGLLKKLFYSEERLYAWGDVLAKVLGVPLAPYEGKADEAPVIDISKVTAAKPEPKTEPKKHIETRPALAPVPPQGPQIRVGFADMWDQFNPSYNFFTLLLEAACADMTPKPNIIGVECVGAADEKLDIMIFGPFGSVWQSAVYKDVPKAHYTGENSPPIKAEGVFLNMGYKQLRGDDAGYVRLPLWMLEIDWFGADAERIQNPKPLPLASMMTVDAAVLEAKDRFCAFVVTNPRNEMRNNSFHWLSKYKRVDSAGRLFNNVGPEIYAGLGGGGGELKKHTFLKKYKFCLTYENEMCEGYTTEKILHAKAAGCVPIYWGDPLVERDFDGAGFLNANQVRTEEELVSLVKKVDEDPEAWHRMASVPALDPYRRDLVRRRLSFVAGVLLNKLGYNISTVPRFLGQSGDKSGDEPGANTAGNDSIICMDLTPHYITYASAAVLHNLHRYVESLKSSPATIFLAPDVPAAVAEKFREVYPQHTYVSLAATDVQLAGFADFWEPKHYAWKPYILQRINRDPSYSGKRMVYLDCGAVVVRQPDAWLDMALSKGVVLLEDLRQRNRTWCHVEFCGALDVSDEEKDAKQIWAGGMTFIAGCGVASRFFDEAWAWAQKRAVIVGEKWISAATGASGAPGGNTIGVDGIMGHRHDQSIFSIIRLRHGIAVAPLDSVYCDHSCGLTERTGAAFYVHRGGYVEEKQVLPGIDDACIINLKRRSDRLEKFRGAHPDWAHLVRVHEAVNGRALALTPAVAALFKPNDFHWKKAILGCALSHLGVWKGIVSRLGPGGSTIGNCLVLEDDVLFNPDFLQRWPAAAAQIPADYDILYLGGVLPPNKAAFGKLLEPVNTHWSRIKEHTFFGQQAPNRYFHFCNYSYIMRRSAAQKLLASIEARGGYHTSADHMICNEVGMFKHYVLTPLAAGCYQDADPKYATSQFNDFSRVDGFDSDLWNNDDRFTKEEIEGCLVGVSTGSAASGLVDAALESLKKPAPAPASVPSSLLSADPNTMPVANPKHHFYSVGPHRPSKESLLEHSWLQYLMDGEKKVEDIGTAQEHARRVEFVIEHIEDVGNHEPLDGCPIFIVQRPYVEHYRELFLRYDGVGKKFKAIHLSDEFGTDPVDWVRFGSCAGVVRNYPRADLSGVEGVWTVPLGWARSSGPRDAPWQQTPGLPFRELVWSFYGTRWAERDAALEPLKQLPHHECVLYDSWMDPAQLGKEAYLGRMLNSMFVPCPGGNNVETFRFYEALECGAIPVYVRKGGDDEYVGLVKKHMNMLEIGNWAHATGLIGYLLQNKEVMEKYRLSLQIGWAKMKVDARAAMHAFLEV
jgi:GR25 family glycosyltransferase involved in LPS biosynthesis